MDDLKLPPKQEFMIIEEAAKAGNVQAQIKLAKMYAEGIGTEINLELAKFWNNKAKGKQ